MFGGVAFLLNGNMTVGVHNEDLIVRVGPEAHDKSLTQPNTKRFDITGRPMKGWIMVMPEGHSEEKLVEWISIGLKFARSLPPK